MNRIVLWVVMGLTLCFTGCADDDKTAACETGSTQFCSCIFAGEPGIGVQLCVSPNQGWGECDCGAFDPTQSGSESTSHSETQSLTCEDGLCPDGSLCVDEQCDATLPSTYAFSEVLSEVTRITLPQDNPDTPADERACCEDFDGDGQPDNVAGSILSNIGLLSSPGFDPEALWDNHLKARTAVPIMEFRGLDDVWSDEALQVATFAAKQGADSALQAAKSSFHATLGVPRFTMRGSITDGVLSAGPGMMILPFPVRDPEFIDAPAWLTVKDAALTATASLSASGNGLAWTDGQVSGVLDLAEVTSYLGALFSVCDCPGMRGADIVEQQGEASVRCSATALTQGNSWCEDEPVGTFCHSIGTNLALLCEGLVLVAPDVDTDGNGVNDGMSLGLHIRATGTSVPNDLLSQ